MRPYFVAWACVASIATPAWGQSWTQQAISMAERNHDFGTVARAASTEHRFTIRNVLEHDMHLRSIRTSCGCTTPSIETEWIKPGQTGTVLAHFNTGTHTGARSATVTVTIDKPVFTEIQFNVKGYIRSDVVLSPGEVNFGTVPIGESKQAEVFLDYAGRNDWAINKVSSEDRLISASAEEVSRSAGRVRYKLSVSLSGDAPPGFRQNQLVLHTNDRRLTTVPVRYLADVQAPLSISPQSVALGDLKPGEPVQRRVLIKGQKPFRVLDVNSEHLEVRFEPTTDPKPVQFLNIIMAPIIDLASDGDVNTSVVVTTDLEGEKNVEMDVSYRLNKASKTVSTAPNKEE